MVIFYGDALVLEMSFKVVGTVRGDIEQGRDPQGVKHVSAGSMVGTAEVEEREDLHGAPPAPKRNIKKTSVKHVRNQDDG